MTAVHHLPARREADDDATLLRRSVAGDGGAFGRLVDRHAGTAYAVARRILGATPAAEDAVQDALLQLWRQGARYAPDRGSVRSWLLVLVRSRALDLRRREQVRAVAAERAIEDAREIAERSTASFDSELVRRETARDVRTCLTALPAEQRQVIGLLYLGGSTQAEVASDLDVPLGTVKGRTRLGLAKLRRELAAGVAA